MTVYKRIFVIGKNINLPINSDNCKGECLVIGTNEKGFELGDLEVLKDKIDFSTRIDIFAHGLLHNHVLEGLRITDNDKSNQALLLRSFGIWAIDSHYIIANDRIVGTGTVLSYLSELVKGQPLFINLYSCYSGAANEDVLRLSNGSILVTRGYENHPILSKIATLGMLEHNGMEEKLSSTAQPQDILFDLMQTCSFNKNVNGSINSINFGKNINTLELLNNPYEILRKNLEKLSKELELNDIKLNVASYLPQDLIEAFMKGYIMYLASIDSPDLTNFLTNSSLSREDFDNLLNKNHFNETALLSACYLGRSNMVKLLVKAGADCEISNEAGFLPLHIASYHGYKEIAETLIDTGCKLDTKTELGFTPLMLAFAMDHKEIVEPLIKAGASIVFKDSEGNTAFHYACSNGYEEIVNTLLLTESDINAKNNNGNTALHKASINGHKVVVKKLIESGSQIDFVNQDGKSALYFAAQWGHLEIVKMLLEAGAYVDFIDNQGNSALHQSSLFGHIEVVIKLIDAGINLELFNQQGQTALMVASSRGNIEVVKNLLKAGAYIDFIDNYGSTALLAAVDHKHMEIVKILIEAGAELNIAEHDPFGYSSRKAIDNSICMESNEITKLLFLSHIKDEYDINAFISDTTFKALYHCSRQSKYFNELVTNYTHDADLGQTEL